MTKGKRILKTLLKIIIILACFGIFCIIAALGVSEYVVKSSEPYILSEKEAGELENIDCILVLGCRVNGETPSPMLLDRLKVGARLYSEKAAPKLLMSGDHGRKDYDEVNSMKKYAMEQGIPDEDIFMDHAGFSTYESMYRARDVFAAKRILIVTQSYHLSRAVYIARKLGLEAYGVPSDLQSYTRQVYYDTREILARDKDFIFTVLKPEPTYLGDIIPISGSGALTNDK